MSGESDEAQDLSEVEEVWLGNAASMPGEEFVEALETVVAFQESLRELKSEFAALDVGLDRDDAMRLIYGRNSQFSLSQVEAAFEVMDAVIEEDPDDIAPRLMADQTSELTIAEAAEVWDDLVELATKYGSLNAQTDDSDQ